MGERPGDVNHVRCDLIAHRLSDVAAHVLTDTSVNGVVDSPSVSDICIDNFTVMPSLQCLPLAAPSTLQSTYGSDTILVSGECQGSPLGLP